MLSCLIYTVVVQNMLVLAPKLWLLAPVLIVSLENVKKTEGSATVKDVANYCGHFKLLSHCTAATDAAAALVAENTRKRRDQSR
jgi:hypothetical protein